MPLLRRIANSIHRTKDQTPRKSIDFKNVIGCRCHPQTTAVNKAMSASRKTLVSKGEDKQALIKLSHHHRGDAPLAKEAAIMVLKPLLLVQHLEDGTPLIAAKATTPVRIAFKEKTQKLLSRMNGTKAKGARTSLQGVSCIPTQTKIQTPRPPDMSVNLTKADITAEARRLRAAHLWDAAPKPCGSGSVANVIKLSAAGRSSTTSSRSSSSSTPSSNLSFSSITPSSRVSSRASSAPISTYALTPEVPPGLSSIPFPAILASHSNFETNPVSGEAAKVLDVVHLPSATYETRGVGTSSSTVEEMNYASEKDVVSELARVQAENDALRMRLSELENKAREVIDVHATKAPFAHDTKAIIENIMNAIADITAQSDSVPSCGPPPPSPPPPPPPPPPGMKVIIPNVPDLVDVHPVKRIAAPRLGLAVNDDQIKNSLKGLKKVSAGKNEKENAESPSIGRFHTLRDCLRSKKGNSEDSNSAKTFAGFRAALKPVSARPLKCKATTHTASLAQLELPKAPTSLPASLPSSPIQTILGPSIKTDLSITTTAQALACTDITTPCTPAKPISRVMQLKMQMARVNAVTPAYELTVRNDKVGSELALLRKMKPVAKGLDNLVPMAE